MIRYFDAFTGYGGFSLGIRRVFGDKAECVGYSEIDKYATSVYGKQFSTHNNYGDITKINPITLPDFDLLTGGFPCQAFSIAGKRAGFNDTRGTLFFDVARILKIKRPRNFILENVKGLLSHDSGRTFKVIIAAIAELGYCVEWQVLNAKDFGVPQNRERVFIIGHLGGVPERKVFPFGEDDRGDSAEGAESEARASSLTTKSQRYGGDQTYIANALTVRQNAPSRTQRREHENYIGTLRTHKDGRGFREMKQGLSPTIPARARQDGSGQPVIIQKSQDWRKSGKLPEFTAHSPTIRAEMGDNHPMVQWRETKDGVHQFRNDKKKSSIQGTHITYPTGKTHALNTRHQPMTEEYFCEDCNDEHLKIRRLTPVECERLMGLPDNWTAEGLGGKISDTQRYKLCGNGVVVNVVEAVVRKLFEL